jgi:hypothetical protein
MVGPPLLVKRPPGEIPPPYRNVMDAHRPLPGDVVFIKQDGHVSMGEAWALAGFFGTFGLVMLVGPVLELLKQRGKGPPGAGQLVLWGVLLILGSGLAWLAVRTVQKERALDAERRSQGFRYGLFLFPDALLLRLHGEPCTLVPRALIQRQRRTDGLRSGDRIWLHVQAAPDAELQQIDIPGSLGSLTAAASQLRSWNP